MTETIEKSESEGVTLIVKAPARPLRVVPLILLLWLVAAAVLAAVRWQTLYAEGPVDVDSVMRLVQVRDYLDGQSWFDTVQRRLGAPEGTSLHWSRFIDAPIAGLILLSDQVAGSRWTAEMLAVTVWPLLLLLALMAATAWFASALGDRVVAALAAILAIQPGPALVNFFPGIIDHHNVQLVLSLLFAACILRADRSVAALAGAGMAAGVMLAIGPESLPVIVAGSVILTLAWLFEPDRFARPAVAYGLAFAATPLASLAATTPADRWLAGSCDALSASYASVAAAGGFGLAVFAMLLTSRSVFLHRALALAGLGVICILLVVRFFPDCLSGPLGAIDPRTEEIWYSRILETRSLADLFTTEFATAVAILMVPLIAFVTSLWQLSTTDEETRYRWAAAAFFIGTALFGMLLQNRAAAAAGALAMPVAAWLAVQLARRGRGEDARVSVPLLIVVLPFVSFVAWHIVGQNVLKPMAPRFGLASAEPHVPVARDCLEKSAFRELAAFEPTYILTQTGLASSLLAYTRHTAVAGNYHRGVAGILDTYEAFASSGDTPTEAIARRGIGLIVVCHEGADGKVGDEALVKGLLGRLKRGEVPDWLEPVFAGDRLLAYRVKAQ